MSGLSVFRVIVVAIAFVSVAVSLPACAGRSVREAVVLPALGPSVDPIAAWAAVYLETLPVDDAASSRAVLAEWSAAVSGGDRAAIRDRALPLWPAVRSWSLAGVTTLEDRGQIGPGVADSYRENLLRFAQAIGVVSERLE